MLELASTQKRASRELTGLGGTVHTDPHLHTHMGPRAHVQAHACAHAHLQPHNCAHAQPQIRDLYTTFRNFRNRLADFLRFRQVRMGLLARHVLHVLRLSVGTGSQMQGRACPLMHTPGHTHVRCRAHAHEGCDITSSHCLVAVVAYAHGVYLLTVLETFLPWCSLKPGGTCIPEPCWHSAAGNRAVTNRYSS